MTESENPMMVRLRGVNKRYGDIVALHHTDLDVRSGEFLTLLGPSGSGKTTLLNMIAGMAFPTSGSIEISGRDVTKVPAEKRGLGMVFQNYALMPHMTVYENIAFPLQVRKYAKSEIKKRVAEVLELVRLPEMAPRKPKELSGGQQQRISIARCIVYRPDLILMDEPLGALDKKLREQMQLEIKRIHNELGMTMIYVTHDQEEALNMSDRIMLMNAGNVEQLSSPNDLYFNPVSQFAADFIGASTLLDAEVVDNSQPSHVRIGGGRFCRVFVGKSSAGCHGKLLLRPEVLRLLPPTAKPAEVNCVDGHVVGSLATGGTIKHFVKIESGETVTIQELTNETMTRFEPGEAVCVTWPYEAARFLDR